MAALIVKYTVIEAYKKHLLTLLLCAFIACIILAYYVKNISITETSASFVYFYNAAIRISSIFLLACYCMITQNQIMEKARIQVQMALPISRAVYSLSTLAAYHLIALMLVIIVSLPLVIISEYHAGIWALSFLMELSIVLCLAYLLALVFRQVTTAISCFTLIYIFARNAAEFTRHADNALLTSQSIFEMLSLWTIKITALLVPKLESYANSSLLESGINPGALLALLLETVLYIALIFCIIQLEMRKKIL